MVDGKVKDSCCSCEDDFHFSEGRKLSWGRWLILFRKRIWPDEVFNGGNATWRHIVHPWSLRWNIIMEVWKIIFLWKWVIWSFHLNLNPGVFSLFSSRPKNHRSNGVVLEAVLGFQLTPSTCCESYQILCFSPRLQDFVVMCLRFGFVFFPRGKMHCFVMKFFEEVPRLFFLS